MLLVASVDGAQYVEFDFMLAQVRPALHYFVEGTLLAAIESVSVVNLAWTVDAQADEKIVFLEEGAPFIIEKDAVSLKSMFHGLVGPAVLFDKLDGAAEELYFHQSWLASLPCNRYGGRAVRLKQLANVGFESGIRHPVLFVGI